MSSKTAGVFRIRFINQDKIYELHAREASQSSMHGFIEIGDFIFAEQSQLLVDPAEEKLKSEFGQVRHSYIPVHSVIRIDEVAEEGKNKIIDSDGKTVTSLPVSHFPGRQGKDS